MKKLKTTAFVLISIGIIATLCYVIQYKKIMVLHDFETGYLEHLLYGSRATQLLFAGIFLPAVGAICSGVIFFKSKRPIYILVCLAGFILSAISFWFLWEIN